MNEYLMAQGLVKKEVGIEEGAFMHPWVAFALHQATRETQDQTEGDLSTKLFELRALLYFDSLGKLNGHPYDDSVMEAVTLYSST